MIFEVVAGAECLVPCTRDDGNPQLGVGSKFVEHVRQLLVRHRVQRVVNLRTTDGDDHQASVDLDLAVLAHVASSSCSLFPDAGRGVRGRLMCRLLAPDDGRPPRSAKGGLGPGGLRGRRGGPTSYGKERYMGKSGARRLGPNHFGRGGRFPVDNHEETVNCCIEALKQQSSALRSWGDT
jgi:hypothetical protein